MPKRTLKRIGWIVAGAAIGMAFHWLLPMDIDTIWLFLVGGFALAAGATIENERQSREEQRREEAQRAGWLKRLAPIRDEREKLLQKIRKLRNELPPAVAWEVLTKAENWIHYAPIEYALDEMNPPWW